MKINDLKSLRMERDQLKYKSKVDKEKLFVDFKLLKLHLIEDAIKGFGKLFKKKQD